MDKFRVVNMEKTKFTDKTTPLHTLEIFKQALKSEVQRRRLGSEFSTMKQRVTESIDRFAFRFKNNLHRLAKLGEPVDRNSPQFIMSQFISKTKPDIQKHLVLKAEEYKDLSEIIEAAKRIERSFSPSHSQPNKQSPEQTNALTTNPAPDFPRGRGKGVAVIAAIPMAILKATASKKRRKTTILRIPKEVTKFAVYRTNIIDLPASYQNQLCRYGRLHNCNSCSKSGCKDIKHANTRPPVVNSCDVQQPQVTQPGPRSSEPPSSGVQSQSSNPPLFLMPTLPHSSNELSVNLNRSILSCQVTSAGKVLQLPLDSCCSVTLCSLDHAQHIHSARPELKYKKLEKPIPMQMADTSASLIAVAVQEVPIAWLPNKETVHVALVVPNMSWPLLFGENHLAAAHALSDLREKTVTFRHPAMNFTISCDKAPVSQDPHAAVTCLLTGKQNGHAAPT